MRRAMPGALTILILLGAAVGAPLTAEEPVTGPGLEREVRQLNATLAELVELLRRQLESSNAAVLMQRVQLMTSRIAPLEDELRIARGELGKQERELEEITLSAASWEASIETQVEQGNMTEEQARILTEGERPVLEQRKKQIEDRLWATRQRVIDLEQRLDKRRAEIETWEVEIDRVLGLR